MSGEHARLAPSASSRWLPCPGSAVLLEEEDSNPAAEAGRVGHKIGEKYLLRPFSPLDAVLLEDEVFHAVRPILGETRPAQAKRVAKATSAYVSAVVDLGGHPLHEIKVHHPFISDFFGTIDTAIPGHPLTIVDLKTGQWAVRAKNNTQLLCYSLLAMREFQTAPVVTSIIQPQCFAKPEVATYSRGDLLRFEEQVHDVSQRSDRHAGKHCRFCPLRKYPRRCHTFERSGVSF